MRQEERLDRIRAIADRVARGYGLEIFDVHFRREPVGLILRIVLDRPYDAGKVQPADGAAPEESVSINDCQRVSQDVSAILDVEEDIEDRYTLEVSSPGLDRPLRKADDYRRFAGRLAKIVVAEAVAGQKHFAGRLKGLEDDTVMLEEGRRLHRIPLGLIARARLDVEF